MSTATLTKSTAAAIRSAIDSLDALADKSEPLEPGWNLPKTIRRFHSIVERHERRRWRGITAHIAHMRDGSHISAGTLKELAKMLENMSER